MKLIKMVRNGVIIPPWYGVAYVSLDKDQAVCLPIPLNIVVGLCVRIRSFFKQGVNAFL